MLQKHINGFDYLRAVFAVCVVIWHAQSLSLVSTLHPSLDKIVDVFYYNVCLLAVPIFCQISLVLFYEKQKNDPGYFLQKRLPSLVSLYGIWMLVGILVNSLVSRGKYFSKIANFNEFALILVKGSRAELYFLFILIFITILAFLNSIYLVKSKTGVSMQFRLLLVSLVSIIIFNLISPWIQNPLFSEYWSPLWFIPYVFSSSILVISFQSEEPKSELIFSKSKKLFLLLLLSIFTLAIWLEWQFLSLPKDQPYLLPPYARISLVIGAFALCYGGILLSKKPKYLVQKISQESLGIYLLHSYFLQMFRLQYFQNLSSFFANPIVNLILALALSICLSMVLKKHSLGRLMLNSNAKAN